MEKAPKGHPTPTAFALSQACQIAIGAVLAIPSGNWPDWKAFLAPFVGVPQPLTYADVLQSSFVLSRFLERAGEEIHTRVHPGRVEGACRFNPARHARIGAITQQQPASWSAATNVLAWADAYDRDLGIHHRRRIVTRALECVNATLAGKAADVARHIGCSVPILHKEFARATGQSLRQYVIRARVERAIGLLRSTDWKIETISGEVGWRSKKNMYEAFGRLIGTTPDRVRKLEHEAIRTVRQRLQMPR